MMAVPAGSPDDGDDRGHSAVCRTRSTRPGPTSRGSGTDPRGACRLQEELDELRDEVTYLKVKLRKEGRVNRAEYAEVRDRIQNLRSPRAGESLVGSAARAGHEPPAV